MNDPKQEQTVENPWEECARKHAPKLRTTLWMALLYLVSAAALSLGRNPYFAVPAWIFLAVGAMTVGRRKLLAGILTLISSVLLLPAVFYGASIGLLLLAVVVGTACGCYFFTVKGSFAVPLFTSAFVGGFCYLQTGNLATALLAPALLLPSFLLSLATLRSERRTTAVCYAVCGILLPLLAATVWFLFQSYGGVSKESVNILLTGWKNGTEDLLRAVREEAVAMPMLPEATKAQYEELFTDANIESIVDLTFRLIPATVVLLCEIAAYLSQKLLLAILSAIGWSDALNPEAEFLSVGIPTVVIYPVGFLLAVFADSSRVSGMLGASLVILLTPVLSLVGFRAYLRWLRRLPPSNRVFPILLAVAFLVCNPLGEVLIFAFFGVSDRLTRALAHKLKDRMNPNDRNGDGNE